MCPIAANGTAWKLAKNHGISTFLRDKASRGVALVSRSAETHERPSGALARGILGGRPGADFWRLELLPYWSMDSARLHPRWYAGFVGCGARLSPTPIIHSISSHHPSPPTRSSPPAHGASISDPRNGDRKQGVRASRSWCAYSRPSLRLWMLWIARQHAQLTTTPREKMV
jgi:hypothetical protein